jgi:hypothetical protein
MAHLSLEGEAVLQAAPPVPLQAAHLAGNW